MENSIDYSYRQINENLKVLSLRGSFSYPYALRIKDKIYEPIRTKKTSLLVDLSELEYIDSVGIGVIVGIQIKLKEKKCGCSLVCKKGEILRVFQLIGLDRSFEVFLSIDEAIKVMLSRLSS